MNRFAMVGMLVATALACPVTMGATFHVAPRGDDTSPGTQQKPFATLQRARDAIRALKTGGPLGELITVYVHGGTYRLRESFELDSQDSGADGTPVVWQAAPGEEVRLSGGIDLPPAEFRPVTDAKTLGRLDPQARDKTLTIDLAALGDAPLGDYPDIFRGSPLAAELFFNDARMTVARWPNDGWAHIEKIIDPGDCPRQGDTSDRPGTFQYTGDRPARWDVASGVWLWGYWCYDWYDQVIRIKAIDLAQRRVTLAKPATYSLKQGNPSPRRYCAINLLEELDRPGEYYVDRAAGRLYFWPPSAAKDSRIVLSALNTPVVVLENAENVVLRGFIVEACLGDGIAVSGGRDNRIEGCTVRNTRQIGIRVTGGTRHRVADCDIHDTGTGGLVLAGGDRKTLTPAGHEAADNRIHAFSRLQLTSAYGITLGGVGNRAVHNLVYDAPHQAIAIMGNDHVFEFNIVRNVCTETDDCGALYKGRNPSCRGNIIRHNFWRDIGGIAGLGTAAVYFDDGDGGDTVVGNVFYRCGYAGKCFGTVFSHGGHDILAENNVFIECERPLGSAPWKDRMWIDAIHGGQDFGWQTKLLEEVDVTRPPYTTRYPNLVGFMDPKPGQPRISRAKNNVFVRCKQVSCGNWTYAPEDNWSTDVDPGFVDADGGNFQLRSDAEVFMHLPGFQPIPFDKIGPTSNKSGAPTTSGGGRSENTVSPNT